MIFNYICGYVVMEIAGLGLERFINRAMQKGIAVWDVERTGEGSIRARVDVAGFYALRKLVRNEGWRVHIRNKRGLIMLLSALRRRKVLLYGWIPALFLLLWASRMVWVIELDGCDRVEESRVLESLAAAGVEPGTPRRAFRLAGLNEAVQTADERIAVASVTVSGVVLHVEIREAEEVEAAEASDAPAHVVAKKDGQIRSLTALRGRGVAKPGDVVMAGDVLISGDLRATDGTGRLVRARGTVVAETVYIAQAVGGDEAAALAGAERLALSQVDKAAILTGKQSRCETLPDGRVRCVVVLRAREDIGAVRELDEGEIARPLENLNEILTEKSEN